MLRHVRQNCKIANTEEGMEKLMDHTLQQQLVEQNRQLADQGQQLARLTALVEEMAMGGQQQLVGRAAGGQQQLVGRAAGGQQQLVGRAAADIARPAAQQIEAAGQVNNGPVVNNVHQVHQVQQVQNVNNVNNVNTVQVHQVNQVINQVQIAAPWDSDRRITVGVQDMIAAFAENPRLQAFARLPDHEMADHEIGGPFVIELFMDLIRRAHADPTMRNVYLNPRRMDQVLVYHEKGRWEVFPLPDTIRLMMDGISEKIRPVILTPKLCGQLPLEAQNALAMAGMLYEETPDAYARRAKGLMSAHLANMAPQQLQRG
jgi:hypothetical protein